jgi:uncharacterized protein
MSKSRGFRWALACVALLLGVAARADMYEALRAYDQKDYPRALELFRELAELGQLDAQEFLADMYVHGEGAPRSNVLGYAWAKIATENGSKITRTIVEQIEPHLTPRAREKIDEVYAQFSPAALRHRVLPNIFDRSLRAGYQPCKMIKSGTAKRYPAGAVNSGVQGSVYVEFTVMPDGHARNPRIVYAVPVNTFDRSAREVILSTEFAPATTKGVPEPCTMAVMVRYRLDARKEEYSELMEVVKDTKEKADKGDARSQLLYGLLAEGLPQLAKSRNEAMPSILKAAQSGMPTAQFMVGYRALQGWGCECDEPKALVWLHKAAASDQADAQVVLAHYLLRGEPTAEQVDQAFKWLERAASNRSEDGKFYLAALLAAASDPARRDGQRAMELLEQVMGSREVDPAAYEVRAAAKAALGDFPSARKDQERALKMAQKLGWETASQTARLAAYTENETWSGNLLAF